MTKLKKTVGFLDDTVNLALRIFAIILMLVGGYALYDSYMVYDEVNNRNILNFKPGYEKPPGDDREIDGNMVAWLTIDDTTIDYPVMQGTNNTEYLNKSPFGDYSLAGSIFLDAENSSDFSDYYSLIYGHHMEHGAMFGALDDFRDEEYLKTHKTGTLIIGEEEYPLRLFAVTEAEATEPIIFSPATHGDKTLEYIKKRNMIYNKTDEVKGKEKLIALSTCKYPESAVRTVVFAALETEKKRPLTIHSEADKG